MPTSFGAVVISTPAPSELAAFYRALLDWQVVAEEPDWVRLRDPERERPGLSFQRETGDRPPAWPSGSYGIDGNGRVDGGIQMQAHLDFLVDDLDREVERATLLGATIEQHQPTPGVRVMRDPHGHLFCLFLPGS